MEDDPSAKTKEVVVSIKSIKTEEEAVIICDWDVDPQNPRNWKPSKKWLVVGIVSFYTLVPPLASSMMAPGLPEIAEKYHITNPTIVALTLSIFLLSFGLGPLILAPLSEMYGRTWILHICNVLSLAFNLGCAFSPNVGTLIALRLLSGFSGSAPLAIGSGSISDLFPERNRASAMAIWFLGPLFGPAIGPVAGGFITQTIGIKWVFITIACLSALASMVGIPFLKETYAPLILKKRAKLSGDRQAEEGNIAAKAQGDKFKILWLNLSRPIVLLFGSFICFMLSLYSAVMYGINYLMFTTLPTLFIGVYGFSTGISGLAYLGLGVGFIIATIFGGKFADRIYGRLADKNGGVGKPEMRMPALFVGALIAPIGLFCYGWSAQAKTHWIVPIIGTGIFAFAMMTTFLPIQLYLVDTFTYAASATAAAAVFRSVFAFTFPLFGKQMFDKLGEGWGNTLLACVAIVLGIPFPVWIYYKGEAMRAKSSLAK